MNAEALQAVALTVAAERSVDRVLTQIVEELVLRSSVALARVWLVEPGDICPSCPLRTECADRTACLHLAASAGAPLDPRADWTRLDGAFSRFPLGARKIGHIGKAGEGILIENVSDDRAWIANPHWVQRERIRSFGGQPLIFKNQVLGVLGVFSREVCDRDTFAWLRTFADHAAIAIAHARALAEIDRLRERLELENTYLRENLRNDAPGGIIGGSRAIKAVLAQMAVVAPTAATVLIEGESGTGKELVARAIHDRSDRRHRPLIGVNCASIPHDLFESEFFGHVKGAFTGALRDRAGRFLAADGGTLFLDEVSEIPLDLQGKLLRVLQEGQFERVGDEATRKVDVRIVAATNRNLREEAAAGRFRSDLFYRLSVFPIVLPALRERAGDILPLATHFVEQAARRHGRPAPRLTAAAVRTLDAYRWPGNIRELQHVIERAVLLSSGGTLRLEGILAEPRDAERLLTPPAQEPVIDGVIPDIEWRKRERENLQAALRQADGRVYGTGGAAELLGVRPTTLASRLKTLGLKPAKAGGWRTPRT